MEINEHLKNARKKLGLTLRGAASLSGLAHQYIWRLENGKIKSVKKKENVVKLSKLYGLSPSVFDQETKAKQSLNYTAASPSSPWRSRSYYQNDVETSLGYPISISYYDYLHKYKRQDVANRIIGAPVKATWADVPVVYESNNEETPFEIEWEKLTKNTSLYANFYKVDLMAMIGRYACLYIGLDDSGPIDKAPTYPSSIEYLTPLPEPNVSITLYDTDESSPRFGKPEMYQINVSSLETVSVTRNVHWTRVLHVAESTIENEFFGSPALEPVYNRLIGLEKIAGASPEIYWLGARGGFTAQTTQESGVLTEEDRREMEEQLSEFTNNLRRWLFADGIDIKSMAPQVVSPKEHVEVQLQLISAATRIPVRILTGSERGELSSSQDERSWLAYIEERRDQVGTKLIINKFIERAILLGVLPAPSVSYTIEWPPLVVLSEKEKAEIGKIHAETLAIYSDSISSSQYIPPEIFLSRELGLTESEVELALNITEDSLENEDSLREDQNVEF